MARDVELVKAAHDAFLEGNIEGVLDMLDERITWTIPASLPYGGVYNGRKEVAEFFAQLPDYFEEIQLKPETLLEGADLVMDVGTMTGRSKLGAEGDASFELRYCLVWRMRNGKAIEMEEFSDTAGILRAIAPATSG